MTPTSQESGPTWTTFTKGASKHKDSLCLWFIALSIPTVESPTHLSALHSDQISRVIEYLDTWDKYHTHWMGSLLIRSSSNSNSFVCLSWTAWHSLSKKSCSTLYHGLMFLPWSMTLTLHIKVNQSSGQKVYVLTDCVWEQQHKKNCLLLYHFLPTYRWKIVWPVNEPFGNWEKKAEMWLRWNLWGNTELIDLWYYIVSDKVSQNAPNCSSSCSI